MESKNILLMISPVSLQRMDGISRYAKEHRWNLMTADRLDESEDPSDYDGVLMTLRDNPAQVKTARRLIAAGVPAVDLTIERPDIALPRSIGDHRAIGRIAAKHFLDRGFTNFAWFATGRSHVHDLRRHGFRDAIPEKAAFTRLNRRDLAAKLAKLPRPLAVLAYNETDAARVVWTVQRLGLAVPLDVAVLGVGNDPFLCENQAITISSVEQRLADSAYEGAKLLDRLIEHPLRKGEPLPSIVLPPGEIHARESSDTLSHPDPIIRDALVYIHRNLSKSFGIAEISAAIGVNRNKLNSLFTATTHRTVGEEILRQRIARAERLLADPAVAIGEISRICGFCNPAYFTNTFLRVKGMNPRAYRKKNPALVTRKAAVRNVAT